jgi:hypothetical protein
MVLPMQISELPDNSQDPILTLEKQDARSITSKLTRLSLAESYNFKGGMLSTSKLNRS